MVSSEEARVSVHLRDSYEAASNTSGLARASTDVRPVFVLPSSACRDHPLDLTLHQGAAGPVPRRSGGTALRA
jgi:hypothetical protein